MIASDIVIAGRVRSNQIGKAFFGAPEAMDPEPQKKTATRTLAANPGGRDAAVASVSNDDSLASADQPAFETKSLRQQYWTAPWIS
jgi:hypothetical protein